MPIVHVHELRHDFGHMDITYPVVVCDWCQERIKDAKAGNYIWRVTSERGVIVDGQIYFLHKGNCNRSFEHYNSHEGWSWHWEELRVFYHRLALNLGQVIATDDSTKAEVERYLKEEAKDRRAKRGTDEQIFEIPEEVPVGVFRPFNSEAFDRLTEFMIERGLAVAVRQEGSLYEPLDDARGYMEQEERRAASRPPHRIAETSSN